MGINIQEVLYNIGINPTSRAEQVSPTNYVELARVLHRKLQISNISNIYWWIMSSYKYDKNNIFFKIIYNQVSSDKVYQDDDLIIINDIYPVAEHHFLAIPTIECVNYDHFLEVADKEVIVIFL